MLLSYIKPAWRNCRANPGYTALNIIGLAIGMAVSLVIGLWVWYQYSYDRFLPGYENVYQLKTNFSTREGGGIEGTMPWVSVPLTETMKKDVPGVEKVALTLPFMDMGVAAGDKKMVMTGGAVDPAFLDIFQYKVLSGTKGMLEDPNSIVLTASAAKALFGAADPMDKVVRLENQMDLRVTGVIADMPANATYQFKYLLPWRVVEQQYEWIKRVKTSWGNNSFYCFLQLTPGADQQRIIAVADAAIKKAMGDGHLSAVLHPLKQWHLYDKFTNGKVEGGFITYVHMFLVIGLLILLIACINFVNLSTAQADKRAKEVGVRKAIGSTRGELIMQFLMQSLLLTAMATAFSLVLVVAVMPFFNALAGTTIAIPYASIAAWSVLLLFMITVSLLAGIRPAFLISGFRPVVVLKGLKQPGKSGGIMKTMVVIQFAASVALIIATVVIYQQIQYGKSRPTGYKISGLVSTVMSPDLRRNYHALKNDLLASGTVTDVTESSSPITEIWSHSVINNWPGKTGPSNSFISIARVGADEDYYKTIGMELSSGRLFNNTVAADSGTVVLNEAAVKEMGLKDPVGQTITWDGDKRVTIVGVVKNTLMVSPFIPAEATLFHHTDDVSAITYRLSPKYPTQEGLEKIGVIFSRYNPAYPFTYAFADVDYEQKFKMEVLTGRLAGIFAGLAIFVSCLGLLGLAAYTAARRTKEIAVRKVMGASTAHLWMLLSRQFILLVLVGSAVAMPVAWFVLEQWLAKYSYRIVISPFVFVGALVLAVLVTMFTVSYQAIKAALMNPILSLKSE
ncbi:ABC transporter permease [Chitinophaga sp. Cy-1792]|uniref:ABC transporter permease n=1 Tax=Chitinophaga sp. Cy-1792 TaxID=2608339 RepID=UPI0014202EB9|nr:ABC transporter permease [Chitinophaga sp. Cy-1792]NIG57111.1 FtsX-like permease family protein [Chitinophaga sp. Cy-1792]